MSQSQSTRQLGQKDFQLWQQLLLHKQLKEIHRQKQLQQIHQDTKQQNSLSLPTQKLANQLPFRMVTNKASTCLWSNEMMEHYTKLPPNSQMIIPGIMNCAQHSGMPAMQGLPGVLTYQAIQSVNSLPQFLDPSLCGNPVSTGRGSLDSRLQFQGSSYGYVDAMTYVERNPTENTSFEFIPSDFSQSEQHGHQSCLEHDSLVSCEGFIEKKFFSDSPVQSLNSGSGSASIQLTNEDLPGREQADWPGCLREKLVSQVKPSSDDANLYQKKHRLLSNRDEDVCRDSPPKRCNVGAEGYPYGNHLDSNEYSSACQSIQSGSWSALVQNALGASSSDMVVQEDWSDLTFQNTELSSGSHSAILNENARQQSNWENNSLQGSSSLTSRPFPFCSDADESPNSFPAPTAEQSLMENSYELDAGMLPDNSHHFLWQQGEQMNSNQMYQSCHQKLYFGSSNQAHIQDTSVLSGAWAGQMCELSGNYMKSANTELNAQNTSDIWVQTEKTQFHHVVDQLSERLQRPHGWILNSFGESELVKSAGGSLEMSMEVPHANQFVPAIISNSSELNCKMDGASDVRYFNCGRHAAIDSSNRNSTEYHQHQPNLDEQSSDILLNTHAEDTMVSCDNGQKCGGNDISLFSGRPSGILLSSSQYFGKSLTLHNVQHHPMADFKITHGDTQNQRPYLKGSSQSFALPESFDHLHFPGLPNLSNSANMRKRQMTDSETTAKEAERMQSTTRAVSQHAPTSVALDRSTSSSPQEKRIGQTSQNMPDLLHKVDQSREGNGAVRLCSYDYKTPLGVPASAGPNYVVSNMLHNQPSAAQDFTLGLTPSSQGKPFSNHFFPLQSVSGFGSESVDLQAGSRGQQTLFAIMAGQSASQVHDSTAIASPTLPHLGNQKLQQDRSYLGVEADPGSLSLAGRLNYNAHFRQAEDLYDIPLADQSSQALSASTSSRNSSVNLSSQCYSVNKGHPQQILSTYRGSLSQEHSIDNTKLASKPSVAGGLPKMLHGVWATPSDQQCPSRVKLQKISNLVQLQGVLSQSGETNSLIQKMVDYPSSKKGASAPSDTYSTGMQHAIFEEHDKCNSLQQIPSSKEVDIALSACPAFQTQETVKGFDGSLQFGGTDVPSQDVSISGQQCSENNAQFHSSRSSLAESKSHQTNALITPTLNGQNGTFRYGQILVCDDLNSSEWSPKTVTRNGFSRRNSNNMNDDNLVKQRGNACQGDRLRQITQAVIPTTMASPHSWPLDAVGLPIIPQPKKRKREASELLPSQKALTLGSQRLSSSSMEEMNWAKTTHRLMEKVENMMIRDGPLVPAHKRLILTTQSMQQIIMSVPAAIIKANVLISYEDVVYYIAKLALGNACSLISLLRNNTSDCLDSRNIRQRVFHREGAKVLSKAMEDFIDKSRMLESNSLRLENRASISDVRIEFQDLERCSIIHRFAKFHGRSETQRVETSLSSNFPPGKLLQRQVRETSMPPNHLEGVVCFSL